MTHYIKELQDKYTELAERLNSLQAEVAQKTAEMAEIKGQLYGLEIAAGCYNDLMATGTCNEEVVDEVPTEG